MATGDGGAYSYSLTVFSPSGKLVQIEHALARVSQGTTSLGIKGLFFFLLQAKAATMGGTDAYAFAALDGEQRRMGS